MDRARGCGWVVAFLALLASCRGDDAAPSVVSGDGAEIVVPGGVDASGIAIASAGKRLHDPAVASIGRGWVASPGGVTFDQPVTLRVPVSASEAAGYLAKAQDLSIYTRADGEGRFHRLATRVSADGKMLEAEVKHFSLFQVGFGLNELCLAEARPTDCAVKVCSLADLIESQDTMTGPSSPDDTTDPRTTSADMARSACEHARDGSFGMAVTTLGQLQDALVGYLATSEVTPGTYSTLVDAIREAEQMLLKVPSVDVTGTFLGSLPLGGKLRSVTFELWQRRDGTVMGYVLGGAGMGTLGRTVVSGRVIADQLQLEVEDAYADGDPVTFAIEGTVTIPTEQGQLPLLTGTVASEDEAFPVVWHMTQAALDERRFVFQDASSDAVFSVSVVVNAPAGGTGGGLISGSFATPGCLEDACYGEVYDMMEQEDGQLLLLLETRAGVQLSINVAFTSDEPGSPGYPVYAGIYQVQVEGTITQSRPIIGFRVMGTNTAHASAMLSTFGRLADDLERHADFLGYLRAGSYPPVSQGYVHDGTNVGDLLASLATETHGFDLLTVSFNRFRNLATIPVTRGLTLGPLSPGVDFDDHREGAHGLGTPAEYYDVDTRPPFDQLRHLDVITTPDTDDSVVIAGNGLLGRDLVLPFTIGGQDIVTMRPFGIHTFCNTCPADEPGAWAFSFVIDRPDSTELAPSALAPSALKVLFASGESGYSCSSGEVVESVTTRTLRGEEGQETPGTYVVTLGPVSCDWDGEESAFGQGAAMGTIGSFGEPESKQYALDLDVSEGFPGSFCPFLRMTDEARAEVIDILNHTPNPEQLTEPFVCNEPIRAYPMSLRWSLQEADQNNPVKAIEFTRLERGSMPMYRFALYGENGAAVHSGPVVWMNSTTPLGEPPYWTLHLADNATSFEADVTARVHATPGPALLFVNFDGVPPGQGDFAIYATDLVASYCDDGNPCTDDTMIGPGLCRNDDNSNPCFLGNRCILDDRCVDGVCTKGSTERECPAGFDCLPAVGCAKLPDQGDDVAEIAEPTEDVIEDADGSETDAPANLCQGEVPVVCDEPAPCHAPGICNPETGQCEYAMMANESECDDDDPCTVGDLCLDGICTGSPKCDDDNPCTTDLCDGGAICSHVDLPPGSCDDGLPFTANDACVQEEAGTSCVGPVRDCSRTVTFGPMFAVSSIRVGVSCDLGEGLDVDGNPDTHAPDDFAFICSDGIDNWAALVAADANNALIEELATVTWGTVLMDFKHYVPGAGAFMLPLYAGMVDPDNASCRFTEESCDFLVSYYNFDSSCEPLYRFDDAVIDENTGILTAGGPGTDIMLTVPHDGQVFRGTIFNAQVRARVTFDDNGHVVAVAPESGANSIVAGALRPRELWDAFDTLYPGDGGTIVYELPGIGPIDKDFVQYMLFFLPGDMLVEVGGHAVTANSIGAVFQTNPASVTGFVDSCETIAECDDGLPFTAGDQCVETEDGPACEGEVPSCSITFGPLVAVNDVAIGAPGQGLDLDLNPGTCAPAPCTSGIDNQAAKYVGEANEALQQELATVTWGTILLDFKNYTTPGTDFVLPLYSGKVDPRNADCRFTDGTQTCAFEIPYYNFDSTCAPLYRFTDARITLSDDTHGTLFAGGPSANVTLVVPYRGRVYQGTVYGAQVLAYVTLANGQVVAATQGSIVGGAVRPTELWNAFDTMFPGNWDTVVYDSPLLTKQVVHFLMSNIDKDFHTSGTDKPADAVSIGAFFEAHRATVKGVATACDTALDCDDGNPCTDDTCDVVVGCEHAYNTAPCLGGTCHSGDCE